MSNHWDVKCLDCQAYLGIENANHGVDYMRDLVAHASQLAVVGKALGTINKMTGHVHIDARLTINDVYKFNVGWFAEHGSHHLRPVDETGHLDNQCAKVVECKCCGVRNWCRRDVGHAGQCSVEEIE